MAAQPGFNLSVGAVGPVVEVSGGVVVLAVLDTQHLTLLPPLHKLLCTVPPVHPTWQTPCIAEQPGFR
jgi:hypothetical protein